MKDGLLQALVKLSRTLAAPATSTGPINDLKSMAGPETFFNSED
jgi:hypothetical protein